MSKNTNNEVALTPEQQKNLNKQLLLAAQRKDNLSNITSLFKQGADINAKDDEGRTPLHNAALFRRTESAEFLLKHNADINAKDDEGRTPLHSAVSKENAKFAKLFLASGAIFQPDLVEGMQDLLEIDNTAFINLFDPHDDNGIIHYALKDPMRQNWQEKFRTGLQKEASDEISSIIVKAGGQFSQALFDIFTEDNRLSKALFNEENNTKNLSTLNTLKRVARQEKGEPFTQESANFINSWIATVLNLTTNRFTQNIEAERARAAAERDNPDQGRG
ncbi:MAG: ankyrin domain protein [Rickettsiales bacterium]|jgi:hypothetical protein|nr:ankyrin domain protein [Rickettsiales bacterium]